MVTSRLIVLQFSHLEDCARIAGKSVHDTKCHRRLPFMCKYNMLPRGTTSVATTTAVNNNHNKKENDKRNNNSKDPTNQISNTLKMDTTPNFLAQTLNDIEIFRNSIKKAIGNIETKSNNNVVNGVEIHNRSDTTMFLVVRGGGILCLVIASVFICSWGQVFKFNFSNTTKIL